eukprot:1678591-Prymnesium_polylepis.1
MATPARNESASRSQATRSSPSCGGMGYEPSECFCIPSYPCAASSLAEQGITLYPYSRQTTDHPPKCNARGHIVT